jgi:hypothetical protein
MEFLEQQNRTLVHENEFQNSRVTASVESLPNQKWKILIYTKVMIFTVSLMDVFLKEKASNELYQQLIRDDPPEYQLS